MAGNEGIYELEEIFSSKEEFECKIISYDCKLDGHDNEILQEALTQGIITKERLRFFRLLYSIVLFNEGTKQVLENFKLNINTKIEIVGKTEEKEDYIVRQIKQLSGIIQSIQNILTTYSEINNDKTRKTSENSKHTIIVSPMPIDGMIQREDKFNLVQKFGEILLNTKYDASLLEDFTVTDAYIRTLNESANWVGNLINILIKNHHLILERNYVIGINNELTKKKSGKINNTKTQFFKIEDIIPDKDKRDLFTEIEIEFINCKRKYLVKKSDGSLKWEKKENYLIAFIYKLSDKQFFRDKRFEKNRNDYKLFFENRYDIEFKEQFQKTRAETIVNAFKKSNPTEFDDYFLKNDAK